MLRLTILGGAKFLDLTGKTSRRSGDRNGDCLAKIPTPGGFALVLKLLLELQQTIRWAFGSDNQRGSVSRRCDIGRRFRHGRRGLICSDTPCSTGGPGVYRPHRAGYRVISTIIATGVRRIRIAGRCSVRQRWVGTGSGGKSTAIVRGFICSCCGCGGTS